MNHIPSIMINLTVRLFVVLNVARFHGDTAHVLEHLNVDVSSLSPRSTPRVSYDPVRRVRVLVVSGGLDSVIEVGSAVAIDNTSSVELPGFSINDDAQRADVNEGNLHGSLVLGGGGVTPRGDGGLNKVGVVRAGSSLSGGSRGVRVGLLTFETLGLYVTESRGEISSVATIATGIARYELLRGKDVEGSGLNAIG